ncbi:MAG: hypothetical protein AAB783_01540 [Patescibacteria group bacterium]
MVIKDIQNYEEGDKSVLAATIVWRERTTYQLFFRVPKKYKKFLATDASPFLAAVLLPCMQMREDITVEGSISTQFFANTRKLMTTFSSWSDAFHPIAISADRVVPDIKAGKDTACFFSGGVDSFYTFLKNKSSITHLISVHGFDMYLSNKALYKEVLTNVQKIAKREGVEVVPVETNIRDFVDLYVDWDWEVGGGLGSVALALRAGFEKIYVAGTYSWDQMMPYGTHPDTDPLWSSETMRIIHDGNEARRLDKVLWQIAKSDTALKYLKVCYQNPKGKYNCSKCEKCLRTMLALEIAGVLDKATSFCEPLTADRVANTRAHGLGCKIHMEDNLAEFKRLGKREDLQRALEISIYRTNNPSLKQRAIKRIAHIDSKYNQSRLYKYLYTKNSQSQNAILSKTFARLGILQ